MKTIDFEIEGSCPLKMDRWTDLPQPKNDKGYKEQAEQKVYTNDKGEISIPAGALKAAIREASAECGKKMEGKKHRQSVRASVFVEPDFLSLGIKKPDGIARDIVSRGKGDKVTRVATYRPLIKKWNAKGKIQVLSEEFDPAFLKQAMVVAGMKYGLLSHRPEFGRFVVKSFKEVKK